MQAIMTKYRGPTDRRGSRIKAFCSAGSVTISIDNSKSSQENHEIAMRMLLEKLFWTPLGGHHGRWVAGDPPDQRGYCYVYVAREE